MSTDPDTGPTAAALLASISALLRRVRHVPLEGGLTIPERTALSMLDRTGPTTSSELARQVQITAQAMGATLSGLQGRGLVGAAVSDHPKIVEIVRTLAERGCEVGLSSLRPDRLTDDFVGALKLGGYRTLTTAMDGTSERVRESLERRARVRHLERAAELARKHGMARLKLYLMVGVPGETDADIDECVEFVTALSKVNPIALGIAPFCPKRNTPLADAEFAGIEVVEARLERLRKGLRGRAEIRATSARWAWVEAVLAKGGDAEGRAVLEAARAGGNFRAWQRAFAKLAPELPRRRSLPLATSTSASSRA